MFKSINLLFLILIVIVLSNCSLGTSSSSSNSSSSTSTSKLVKTITVYLTNAISLVQNYTYDDQNRITNVTSTWPTMPTLNGYLNYVYLSDGSMATLSYTNNVYIGTNSITTYFNSNMIKTVTSYQNKIIFGVQSFTYDSQNRLTNLSLTYPMLPSLNNSTGFATLSDGSTAMIYYTNNVYARTNSIITSFVDNQNRITNSSSYNPSYPALTNSTRNIYLPDGSIVMLSYTNNVFAGTNGVTTFY